MIVRGEPSSGKTTFVQKVCKDWSELHLNEDPVRSEVQDVLGPYDLLIPVFLRLVKHGASLEDTIKDQLHLDDGQMLTIHDMLKNIERTVLIMDGLDEYYENTSGHITNIMRGLTFKHIIITARPESARRCEKWNMVSYKVAELLGLTDENIKIYVEKFFEKNIEKRRSLIAHLFQKDSQLLDLARNVGSLCMMCTLHNYGIEIHTMNREQLYDEYVAFRLRKWEQRQLQLQQEQQQHQEQQQQQQHQEEENPKGEETSRSEILKKYHKILIKFGELANVNRKPYDIDGESKHKNDESSDSDSDESSDSQDEYKHKSDESSDSDSDWISDSEDEYKHKSDDEDSMELLFTSDQIFSIFKDYFLKDKNIKNIEDVLHFGLLQRLHPVSPLVKSQFSFKHKTLHEYFLAYFIKNTDLKSFKQRIYKNRNLLEQELSLTRFLLHLYMSPKEAFEFTKNILESKPDYSVIKLHNPYRGSQTEGKPNPDKYFLILLHKLFRGYQHDEYQRTLTFNTPETDNFDIEREYIYIYQYPCYAIRAYRRHEDSLKSYNKDMIRSMNTDNKHKALTVPIFQAANRQIIACGGSLSLYDFHAYCRADYEVTVIGDGSKLEKLCMTGIEKVGDINLHPVKDKLMADIHTTNLHGCVWLTKRWMALPVLRMQYCKLEAGNISVMADSIQACTSPTGAESASPCRLQKLDLGYNSLTGAGADIARIIECTPLCTDLRLVDCDLNDEDFHAIVNAIIQTHSDKHTSVHDHSTLDRRQTNILMSIWNILMSIWNEFIKYVKPDSPGPASHIDRRETSRIKPASPGPASHTDRRQTSKIKPASPGPASHTDRRQTSRIKPASPGPASHNDRRQTSRLKPASPGPASHTDRRQTSRIKPASPGPASHTDRRQTSRIKPASPGPASHTDRRQTSRIKPASPGPASHIDRRQTRRIKLASPEPASHIDRRQTSRIKPASPGPASHTDRRQTSRIKPASPEPASHTDRRQTSSIKPASPGPASHIEVLSLRNNKFSDVETVRLLLDNLPPSLLNLNLFFNKFNEEETEEIRRTYKDKHPNLDLWI